MPGKIRFYTDENVPNAVVDGLRRNRVDVLSVADTGMFAADDEDHLERARIENRVVFTRDADFLDHAQSGVSHCGVVYAPQGVSVGRIVRALMLIYHVLDADEMQDHIEYVTSLVP